MKRRWTDLFHKKATLADAGIIALLTILVTWHPYYRHGELKIFELGLYLPGIQAVFQGAVPFRDFLHLRGPFELYMPALMMKFTGLQLGTLNTYFYAGTVITLIAAALIGWELYRTRGFVYLMTLVMVARTFPRIFFTEWGGMRYAWGLLAVLCMVRSFRKMRPGLFLAAGIFAACGLWTSIEIGVYSVFAAGVSLGFAWIVQTHKRREIWKAAGFFALGFSVVTVPYVLYLASVGALKPCVDTVFTIVTRMTHTFNQASIAPVPQNFAEVLAAMFNPLDKNFRQMTPVFLYLLLALFLAVRLKRHRATALDPALVCIGAYGVFMYVTAFRSIWGPQFEMALQPEKVLFFFLLEETYFFLKTVLERSRRTAAQAAGAPGGLRRTKAVIAGCYAVFFLFFTGTVGYALVRYNRRFFAVEYLRCLVTGRNTRHLRPLAGQPHRAVHLQRTAGIVGPTKKADELEAVVRDVHALTKPTDVLLAYPDRGAYNFFADRPFLGRFPMANLTWISKRWHKEFLRDFMAHKPACVIIPKHLSHVARVVYFSDPATRQKYEHMMALIRTFYVLRATTPSSKIYLLKANP